MPYRRKTLPGTHLLRMRTTRRISSSLPITGSSRAAFAVKSVPYLARASKLASPLALSIFWSCNEHINAGSMPGQHKVTYTDITARFTASVVHTALGAQLCVHWLLSQPSLAHGTYEAPAFFGKTTGPGTHASLCCISVPQAARPSRHFQWCAW